MGKLDKTFRETFDLETYTAVRKEGRPWISREERGIIAVSGAEAVQFLNGMITNDIAKLEEGTAMLAAFPNQKGRLIAVTRVSNEEGDFIFETEDSTYETVLANLERFTLAGDFKVEDLTGRSKIVSIRGESSADVVEKVLGGKPEKDCDVTVYDFRGRPVTCLPSVRTRGLDLRVTSEEADDLAEELINAGAVEPKGPLAEVLRIESGIPKFGIDMDGETVVPEIGLEGLISYQKGCYIGQEVIARIHFRGKVAKELKGLVFNAPEALVNTGDELLSQEGKNAGVVTSKAYSPKLEKHIAMAYVRSAFAENGTELRIGHQTCRVSDLPFIA
ncbi:MAG TPA: glycine cleavage T C-terminal barrel domain-containing protein [Aridibacter sp.]|nr:glycine cleavage T C-terminal barrel domain-containing protein [Aridibacter sp.]